MMIITATIPIIADRLSARRIRVRSVDIGVATGRSQNKALAVLTLSFSDLLLIRGINAIPTSNPHLHPEKRYSCHWHCKLSGPILRQDSRLPNSTDLKTSRVEL